MDYRTLSGKKNILDGFRPFSNDLVGNLESWFSVELTYSSNALEGNTLSKKETALVVEKGITIGGKSLREHLEATNHSEALTWLKKKTENKPSQITEDDIVKIHSIILKGIDDANAGTYRNIPVRISGSNVILPNARKVPILMGEFQKWLKSTKDIHPVELSAEAHYRLVTIHPFIDGNGRTGRLLMNLILLMTGYPPAIIYPRERLAYISSLEKAQLGGAKDDFYKLISKSVNRSLDIYLKAIKGESPLMPEETTSLLKIGQLAKKVGVPNSTIRHWTKEGLLHVSEVTPSGYHLYSTDMIGRCEEIFSLQDKRLSLEEIRNRINKYQPTS